MDFWKIEAVIGEDVASFEMAFSARLFGSGAAFLFALHWPAGEDTCLIFRKDKHTWKLQYDI